VIQAGGHGYNNNTILHKRVDQSGTAHRVHVSKAKLSRIVLAKGEDTAKNINKYPVFATKRDARHPYTLKIQIKDAHHQCWYWALKGIT
jgi:hypothetical protein